MTKVWSTRDMKRVISLRRAVYANYDDPVYIARVGDIVERMWVAERKREARNA